MSDNVATEQIGIRELKTHLSRHLKRVRAGVRLVVTDRGRAIATLTPVESSPETEWISTILSDGSAQWGGGRPQGSPRPPTVAGRRASRAVLDDRR